MIPAFSYFLLLAFVTLSASVDFSLKGDPCSKFDNCYSKSALKTCSCDNDCQAYGTCCHDPNKPKHDESGFQCYSRRTTGPVFAKRSCSDDFRGHLAYKLACLEDDEDEMDVANNLLLTSRKTKVTYWNKHCAKCNNEADADLEFWNIDVSCPPHENVDRSLIRTNLTFDQENSHWGLMIGDEFLQCTVRYSPSFYINEVKHCTPNLVASCPVEYTDEDVSTKCSQYYAERKWKDSDVYFKNIHCAICNGADVKELECPGMSSPEDNAEESDFRETVEEIFSNGEWLESGPGKQFECSKGFSYDPGREKCRKYSNRKEEVMIPNSVRDYRKASLLPFVVLGMLLL